MFTPASMQADSTSSPLCYAYTENVSYYEAPLPNAAGAGAGISGVPLSQSSVLYRRPGSDGRCHARGKPVLSLRSTPRDSALAHAWKESFEGMGVRAPAPARQGALQRAPGRVRIDQDEAFYQQLGPDRLGMYFESDDVAVTVDGAISVQDVEPLIKSVEEQR